MQDERFCSNCRSAIPSGDNVCPACGVYAGDVFDGPPPKAAGRRRSASGWIALLVLVAAAAAGGWWWYTRRAQIPPFDATPAHVMVKGTAEGKAVVALRFHLVTELKLVQSECLAVIGHGYSNGYYRFDAVDSCRRTRLGRWKVDPITFKPSRT